MRWWLATLLALLLPSCSSWDDDARFVPRTRWVYVSDSLSLYRFDPLQPEVSESLGSCTAFDLRGEELWVVDDRRLFRRAARSGQPTATVDLPAAAQLVCAGDRVLLVALGRQLQLRDRRRPDRLLNTLELDVLPTVTFALGGLLAVGTSASRLVLIDERARIPRADLVLSGVPIAIGHDRNYRLRVQLATDSGSWREAVVDVGGKVVVGEIDEPLLWRRWYSPYPRSHYEREWLAEVDQGRDSVLRRWPAAGPVAEVGVDFFSGVAWLWQAQQLRALNLHTGQLGAGWAWGRHPRRWGFYIEVPGRRGNA